MTSAKTARTTEEMRFAAALQPCASCGTHDLGALELRGTGSRWSYQGRCPKCGAARTFEFTTAGDPAVARSGRFDLGAGVSTLIAPEQFLAVLDEASPKAPENLSALTPSQRREALRELTRAMTSVTELLKQVPPAGVQMPGTSDVRLERRWLEREFMRLKKLVGRYRPASSLDQATLDGHLSWLKRGGNGEGRIALGSQKLADEWYGPIDLTFASFIDVDLTNVDLGYAILDEAHLERCILQTAVLDGASVTNARVVGGDWSRVRLATAKLNAAQIDGTDFSRADLERSYWYDAKVKAARFDGARFGNSVFDRAVFERCSFREATFARTMPQPEPTSGGARFIDCDFAGVSFADRVLSGTTFVGCKLAGVQAPPKQAATGVVLENCDIGLASFLAQSN